MSRQNTEKFLNKKFHDLYWKELQTSKKYKVFTDAEGAVKTLGEEIIGGTHHRKLKDDEIQQFHMSPATIAGGVIGTKVQGQKGRGFSKIRNNAELKKDSATKYYEAVYAELLKIVPKEFQTSPKIGVFEMLGISELPKNWDKANVLIQIMNKKRTEKARKNIGNKPVLHKEGQGFSLIAVNWGILAKTLTQATNNIAEKWIKPRSGNKPPSFKQGFPFKNYYAISDSQKTKKGEGGTEKVFDEQGNPEYKKAVTTSLVAKGHIAFGEHSIDNSPATAFLSFIQGALSTGEATGLQAKLNVELLAQTRKVAKEVEKIHQDIMDQITNEAAANFKWEKSFDKHNPLDDLSLSQQGLTMVMTTSHGSTINSVVLAKIEKTASWKALMKEIKKNQEKLMENIAGPLLNLEGSKSIMQKVDAVLKEALHGKKKKAKGLKDTDTNTLIKPKKVKVKKVKIKPKKIKVNTVKKGPKSKKVVALGGGSGGLKVRRSGPSALQLMVLINAKIQGQVKDNMGRPTLINRTGRFAESVKIANATQGKQGLTTFYYDYQKNPYQTFENSSRWPTEYDPRPLISQSIRDIASELMQSRFRSVRL